MVKKIRLRKTDHQLFKTIQLTQGYETIVDAEDYDWLVMMGKWCAQRVGKSLIYARRDEWIDGKQKAFLMHRVITGVSQGIFIDHKNGNGLDNRKANLRFCTHSQNLMNSRPSRNGSSKFKGVWWCKPRNKWRSEIKADGKRSCLGSFDDEVEAAKAYDKAAKELHGEFARLNFPDN